MNVAEYREMVAKRKDKKPKTPELDFQKRAARGLRLILPVEVRMTASAAGVHLPPKLARDLSEAGQEPGWPDWQFLFPDAKTRYIELKWKASLSDGQKDFRAYAEPLGIWAVCRTWDQVWSALHGWCRECGLELRQLTSLERTVLGL